MIIKELCEFQKFDETLTIGDVINRLDLFHTAEVEYQISDKNESQIFQLIFEIHQTLYAHHIQCYQIIPYKCVMHHSRYENNSNLIFKFEKSYHLMLFLGLHNNVLKETRKILKLPFTRVNLERNEEFLQMLYDSAKIN